MNTSLWSRIAIAITQTTGDTFTTRRENPVGGGCINAAHVLENDAGLRYFVKLNAAARLDMFAAEAQGLEEISAPRHQSTGAGVLRHSGR